MKKKTAKKFQKCQIFTFLTFLNSFSLFEKTNPKHTPLNFVSEILEQNLGHK